MHCVDVGACRRPATDVLGRPRIATLTARDVALLALLALLWGGSFTLIDIVVESVPPATLVATRLAIAALALWFFVRGRGTSVADVWRAQPGLMVLLGLTGNALPFVLISWGQTRIDSGVAAILIGAVPLFTMVLAHWFSAGEPLRARVAAGVGLGFVGLCILVAPDMVGAVTGALAAKVAVIGGALSYACNLVLARRITVPAAPAACALTLASVVMIVPVSLLVDAPWTLSPDLGAITGLIALGVLSTALATIVFLHLVATAGATATSLVNYLIPVTGVVLGVVFLGERPSHNDIIALVLIIAGIALVSRAPRSTLSKSQRPSA